MVWRYALVVGPSGHQVAQVDHEAVLDVRHSVPLALAIHHLKAAWSIVGLQNS